MGLKIVLLVFSIKNYFSSPPPPPPRPHSILISTTKLPIWLYLCRFGFLCVFKPSVPFLCLFPDGAGQSWMLQTALRKPVAWNNRYTMSPQSYFNLKCYTSFAFLPSYCPVMREGFPFNDHLPNEDTTTPRKVPQLIILTPLSNPSTTFFLSLFLSCVLSSYLIHPFYLYRCRLIYLSLSLSSLLSYWIPFFSFFTFWSLFFCTLRQSAKPWPFFFLLSFLASLLFCLCLSYFIFSLSLYFFYKYLVSSLVFVSLFLFSCLLSLSLVSFCLLSLSLVCVSWLGPFS